MRPVMTAAQVTQQVSGLLVSSSMSRWQQHRQTRYNASTTRLRPRPTAPTHARNISDWGTEREREKGSKENLFNSWERDGILFWKTPACSRLKPWVSLSTGMQGVLCGLQMSTPTPLPYDKADSAEWKQATSIKKTLMCRDTRGYPLINIISAACSKGDRNTGAGALGWRGGGARREAWFGFGRLLRGKTETKQSQEGGEGASCDTMTFIQSCDFWVCKIWKAWRMERKQRNTGLKPPLYCM